LLPQKQKQDNLIWLIKYLCGSNTCDSTWEWVDGHAAEREGWVNCTLPEWLNELSDKLAKSALVSAIAGGLAIKGDLPFKLVKFSLSGHKVSGSLSCGRISF
jgi:hypothetical protein